MKVQKSVYEMTDRELKIYRRRLIRQIGLRRRMMLLLITCCFILIGTISYNSIKSSANTGDEQISFKYYDNIMVTYGEHLWEIADRYIDYNHYKDKAEYIEEVKHINHLDAEGNIKAGQRLMVPYYSYEFVE